MERNDISEETLGRWANGTLSPEEQRRFQDNPDANLYEAILSGTDLLELPPYNKEEKYRQLQEALVHETKISKPKRGWMYAAAALVVLLAGYYWNSLGEQRHRTKFGEQLTLSLPEGSEVHLNANSELSFRKRKFNQLERSLKLKGEAFFKVTPGKPFKIDTKQGTVQVLGTSFIVNAQYGFFEVLCSTGKVSVEIPGKPIQLLTQGKGIRFYGDQLEPYEQSIIQVPWLAGESTFENSPLTKVLKALENQYNLKIEASALRKPMYFTGSFPHHNRDVALKTVFEALEINFTFTASDSIKLSAQ
jgi:ferric-dicitrate binding protein FerR (iron transport regulator)